MKKRHVLRALVVLSLLGLAACPDGDTPAFFTQVFNSPNNAEPVEVFVGDAGALDFTSEPVEVL